MRSAVLVLFVLLAMVSNVVGFAPRLVGSLRSFVRSATTTSVTGAAGTTEYRVFFNDNGKVISPWHDIPLKSGDFFNFVNEIPKYVACWSSTLYTRTHFFFFIHTRTRTPAHLPPNNR